MKMPFGKHKGEPVEGVPEPYLCWVLENVDNLRPTLRDEIERVVEIGKYASAVVVVPGEDVIGQWYRQLAREFHPDQGGSHEVMNATNRARELLEEMVAV